MPRAKKPTKRKSIPITTYSPLAHSTDVRMELFRQIMHLSVGLGSIAVLLFLGLDIFRSFVLGLLVVGIILSLIASTKRITTINRILSLVERPHEGVPGQGAFYFLVGVGIPTFIFSNPVVVLVGIVALTFQDSFSTITGKWFGRTPLWGKKTLEGFAGGFIACTLALLTFLPLSQAIGISLIVSAVELLPFEDAFSIPFVGSALAHLRSLV